jgi:hypothetical protein
MEILAHINSPATKKNDQRYIRQAEGYSKFDIVRKTDCGPENKMKRRHEGGEVAVMRPRTAEHQPFASTTENITSSTLFNEAHLMSAPVSLRANSATLKRSFSDMIASPSSLFPQSPLKLLELASNKWKSLRGQQDRGALDEKQGPELEVVPTESQLEDTQVAFGVIQDDVYGDSLDTEEAESQGQDTTQKALLKSAPNNAEATCGNAEKEDEPKVFEVSYMPSTLSTFDINASKGSVPSKPEPSPNSNTFQKKDHPNNQEQPFNSEAHTIPESEFGSFHPNELHSELTQDLDATTEDPSNEESQKSHTRSASILLNRRTSLQVNAPHPSASFLAVEGIPNSALTRSLQSLTTASKISYLTSFNDRSPGCWERGFWFIPESVTSTDSGWPQSEQTAFWARLGCLIQRGHAGIATWAARNVNDDGTQPNEDEDSHEGQVELGNVRLYCWGGIAKEVYQLCILESKGRLSGREMKWLSALNGEVVISVL